MGKIFAGAGLIILPFIFFLTGEQFRLPKALTLVLMVGIYLAGAIAVEVSVALGACVALVFASSYFAMTFPFQELLFFSAAVFTCFWVRKPKENDLKVFFKLFEYLGLVIAAHGVLQVFGLDPVVTYLEWADKRPIGFFGQHTLYGPFAVAAFSVSLFYRHWFRAAFLLIPVILVDSSFTYLSLAAVVFVFLSSVLTRKAILGLFIAALTLGSISFLTIPGLSDKEAFNDKGRFALWGQVTQLANRKPIFGYGFGSFKRIYPMFQSQVMRKMQGIEDETLNPAAKEFIKEAERIRGLAGLFQEAHNEFLQVYFEFGAVGLVLIILLIANFFFRFWQIEKTTETWILCAIFSLFLSNAIGNFPLRLVPQALLPLWAYVAMMTLKRPAANMRVYGRPKSKSAL